MRIALLVTAVGVIACSSTPAKRPPATPGEATAPPDAAGPPPDLVVAAPPCTRGTALAYLTRTADHARAIACMRDETEATDCWSIEPTSGAAAELAKADWPALDDRAPPGDALPHTTDEHGVQLRVRPPRTVAIEGYDTKATVVVTCASAGVDCKRVALRTQANRLHLINHLAISDDGALLSAGFGTGIVGDPRTELYDVASGKYRTTIEIKMPHVACTDVPAFPSGNVLVQTTDCANAGGVRVVVNPKGGWLATLGEFASPAPIFDLGNDRWLAVASTELAIWSFAKPRRHAVRTDAQRNWTDAITVAGGAILGVEDDGAIVSYASSDLATTKLGAIPRCR